MAKSWGIFFGTLSKCTRKYANRKSRVKQMHKIANLAPEIRRSRIFDLLLHICLCDYGSLDQTHYNESYSLRDALLKNTSY